MAPGTMSLITRAAASELSCCKSARRETTMFLPPSRMSVTTKRIVWPMSAFTSASSTRRASTCDIGQKARMPPTSTSRPPCSRR